jgi:hypothetical protein
MAKLRQGKHLYNQHGAGCHGIFRSAAGSIAATHPNDSTLFATFPDGFLSTRVKTRIMKKLLNILLAAMVAAALTQLYYANMELRYNCEALAWQLKCENAQLKTLFATNFRRMRCDARKIAELEAKLKELPQGKTGAIDIELPTFAPRSVAFQTN